MGVGFGVRVVGVVGEPMSGTALHDRRPAVSEVISNDGNIEVIPRGGHGGVASARDTDARAEMDDSPALARGVWMGVQ